MTSSPFYNSPTWKYQPYAFVLKTSPFVINITSCYVCECRRYLLLLTNWKHRSTHRFTFLFGKLILPALFAIVVLCACVTLLLLTVLETLSITNRTYSIVGNQYPPLFDIVVLRTPVTSSRFTTHRSENIRRHHSFTNIAQRYFLLSWVTALLVTANRLNTSWAAHRLANTRHYRPWLILFCYADDEKCFYNNKHVIFYIKRGNEDEV